MPPGDSRHRLYQNEISPDGLLQDVREEMMDAAARSEADVVGHQLRLIQQQMGQVAGDEKRRRVPGKVDDYTDSLKEFIVQNYAVIFKTSTFRGFLSNKAAHRFLPK